ncbi:HET-domain-containing protein [Stipitochalara longipes BDJ]|nr:HET-domain-containing protein [Stipitochalara longipes BDJ]
MEQPPIYSPLLSTRHIRVLHITPGISTEEISCSLETICLDDQLLYSALSYVWGAPSPTQYIRLNSVRKAVTPNLHSALRNIRKLDESAVFWIDALCINQEDINERTQQVQLMREVYSHAQATILWLGEEDESTAIVEFDQEKNKARGFPAPEEPDWNAVRRILSSSWFERIWIIQEVVVSKSPIAIIGTHQLEWDNIRVAAAWWFRQGYINIIPTELILQPLQTGVCRSSNGLPMLELLYHGKKFQATDPRDKIFALFGLSHEGRQVTPCLRLVPDYSKSAFDVQLDMLRHELECSHPDSVASLDVLGHVHHWSQFEYANWQTVPTWMPRWDNDNTLFRMKPSFSASGNFPVTLKCPISKTEIILKGVKIGVVDDSSDAFWRLWVRQKWEPKLVWTTTCELYLGYVLFKKHHSQKKNFIRDFALAITMGGSMESRPPTEADFLAYCSENLNDSLSSIPTTESIHPKELSQSREQIADISTQRPTATGDADRVAFQIQHCSLFTTAEYMGMGHFTTKPGDIVCVLFGGKTPFVLRPTGDHYALVGECYVCDLMDGEAVGEIEAGNLKEEWFNLR